MKTTWIDSAESTNTHVKNHANELEPFNMVLAREQTAGRGQRGTSWEAQPGKNLTFSFFFCPEGIEARNQFGISEAVTLAIVEFLSCYGIEARIKWPNDIYVGQKKICGILIENSIVGSMIKRSLIGIGLNVNQTVFLSDAPNPVSMAMITGMEHDLKDLAEVLGSHLETQLRQINDTNHLHSAFMKHLWRNDGTLHPFRNTVTGDIFEAAIENVEPEGTLILKTSDSSRLKFLFKEVEFII